MAEQTENEKIQSKSIQGAMGYALRSLLIQGIGFVAVLLLGYYLSPSDFGVFFSVSAAVNFFTFFSDVGLASALIQKKEEPTVLELRTTFVIQQLLSWGIFALIVVLTPYWKNELHFEAAALGVMYALGFSFILASFKTIPSILLERKLEFQKLVMPQIIENLVFYGVAVYLASQKYGVSSYIYAILARGIIGVILMYSIQTWDIGLAFSKEALKTLMRFGVKFQLNDLLARIKDDLFIVVLARYIPLNQMGFVSWAKRWSMFPYQLTVNSVMSVTFPTYARLQHDKALLTKAIEFSLYMIALVVFPMIIGMIVVLVPVLNLIPGYAKWLPAATSFYFFGINIMWAALSTPLTNTLNAVGEINKTLKLMIMWTSMTWLFTPIFIHFFGFEGVSIASAIIALSSVVTVYYVKQIVPIAFVRVVYKQLLAGICMGAVLFLVRERWIHSLPQIALAGVFGALFYVMLMSLIDRKMLHRNIVLCIPASARSKINDLFPFFQL